MVTKTRAQTRSRSGQTPLLHGPAAQFLNISPSYLHAANNAGIGPVRCSAPGAKNQYWLDDLEAWRDNPPFTGTLNAAITAAMAARRQAS